MDSIGRRAFVLTAQHVFGGGEIYRVKTEQGTGPGCEPLRMISELISQLGETWMTMKRTAHVMTG